VDVTRLEKVRSRILSGPDDNMDRLIGEMDKHRAAGYPCNIVYLSDVGQWAVVKVEVRK